MGEPPVHYILRDELWDRLEELAAAKVEQQRKGLRRSLVVDTLEIEIKSIRGAMHQLGAETFEVAA